MSDSIPVTWRLKKRFWAWWQTVRFSLSKPATIGTPTPNSRPIELVALGAAYDKIPASKVQVYKQLPKEEAKLGMQVLVTVGLFLNRLLPPMKSGLPEIASDPHQALDDALTSRYRKSFRAPVLPAAFEKDGSADLGSLATHGPYALFLERGGDGKLLWDFGFLGDFEHHPDLCSLAVTVDFTTSPDTSSLEAVEITSNEFGRVRPGDAEWDVSGRLAVCAATTHATLTRHFNYVHLISGNHWDVITRNTLPADHPLYRLVWPHLFNSLYTNHGVTRPQLLPDGDFVNMFSFSHDGLVAYFDAMYQRYDIAVTDPDADWARRGLDDSGIDSPTLDNLRDLFGVMHDHARRYIDAYYDSDVDLAADQVVIDWLTELDRVVPNGVGIPESGPTREWLARRVGAYIFEGNTIHDLVGTTLWDYQLWSVQNPTRLYRDGRRVPVDVFQRVINNNFALQLRRAPLLADYGDVALDPKGRSLFTQFYHDCTALQDRYDKSESGPWRMEPANLEINMNG